MTVSGFIPTCRQVHLTASAQLVVSHLLRKLLCTHTSRSTGLGIGWVELERSQHIRRESGMLNDPAANIRLFSLVCRGLSCASVKSWPKIAIDPLVSVPWGLPWLLRVLWLRQLGGSEPIIGCAGTTRGAFLLEQPSMIESSKSTDMGIYYRLSFLGNTESPRNLQ